MGNPPTNQRHHPRTHNLNRIPHPQNTHTPHTRIHNKHTTHRRRNPHTKRMHPQHHPPKPPKNHQMNPIKKLKTKNPDQPKHTAKQTTPKNNPQHWTHKANCKGLTHLMFPQHHKDITYITQARAICNTCPVQKQCLNYALEFPPADMHGVWAGMTSRQLAAKQKELGIKATRPTLAQMWNDNQ